MPDVEVLPDRLLIKRLRGLLGQCMAMTSGCITVPHLVEVWKTQQGRCALSDEPMWHTGAITLRALSLEAVVGDRFDPGNVRMVCLGLNLFRGNRDDALMVLSARTLLKISRTPWGRGSLEELLAKMVQHQDSLASLRFQLEGSG